MRLESLEEKNTLFDELKTTRVLKKQKSKAGLFMPVYMVNFDNPGLPSSFESKEFYHSFLAHYGKNLPLTTGRKLTITKK